MVKKERKSNDDSKLFAFLAVLLSIVGFLIALVAKKEDKYVMFYAKQSLVLFIIAIIVGVIHRIVSWIPIFGSIVSTALNIILVVLWVMGIIYSLSGEMKDIPLVGEYAKKINL